MRNLDDISFCRKQWSLASPNTFPMCNGQTSLLCTSGTHQANVIKLETPSDRLMKCIQVRSGVVYQRKIVTYCDCVTFTKMCIPGTVMVHSLNASFTDASEEEERGRVETKLLTITLHRSIRTSLMTRWLHPWTHILKFVWKKVDSLFHPSPQHPTCSGVPYLA